jgi:predicted nucleic acid-binding protein
VILAICRASALPSRSCRIGLAEASYLLSKVDPKGPAAVLALGRAGAYEVALRVNDHWLPIERTIAKYRNVPASLADACLIRCADVYAEPRIVTFDRDFRLYRWGRHKPFEILD